MSFKKGTYMGGVVTLDHLRERCVIDADTGCWSYRPQGKESAQVAIHGSANFKVRRAALMLAGVAIPKGHMVWAKACCASKHCANPQHTRTGTRKEWGKWLAAQGSMKGLPAKVAANARTAMKRRALTDEQVREVLESDQSMTALARDLSVPRSTIKRIRQGTGYLSARKGSSVFSWRPA